MSDLRLTARCEQCGHSASGTFVLDWIADHLDADPDHFVTTTRSGIFPNPAPVRREPRQPHDPVNLAALRFDVSGKAGL